MISSWLCDHYQRSQPFGGINFLNSKSKGIEYMIRSDAKFYESLMPLLWINWTWVIYRKNETLMAAGIPLNLHSFSSTSLRSAQQSVSLSQLLELLNPISSVPAVSSLTSLEHFILILHCSFLKLPLSWPSAGFACFFPISARSCTVICNSKLGESCIRLFVCPKY